MKSHHPIETRRNIYYEEKNIEIFSKQVEREDVDVEESFRVLHDIFHVHLNAKICAVLSIL